MVNGHGVEGQGSIKDHDMGQPGPDSFVTEGAELENHPEKSVKKSPEQRVKAVFRLTGNNNPDPLDDRDKKDNNSSQNHKSQDYLLSQRKQQLPPQFLSSFSEILNFFSQISTYFLLLFFLVNKADLALIRSHAGTKRR